MFSKCKKKLATIAYVYFDKLILLIFRLNGPRKSDIILKYVL